MPPYSSWQRKQSQTLFRLGSNPRGGTAPTLKMVRRYMAKDFDYSRFRYGNAIRSCVMREALVDLRG